MPPKTRKSDKDKKTGTDDPAQGDASYSTPPRSNSSGTQSASPFNNQKGIDTSIFDASDEDFNSWIKPVCEEDLSEEQFHQVAVDVEAMLDACHLFMKCKSNMKPETWKKLRRTIEQRLVRVGCAIGHLDAPYIRVLFTKLHEAIDFNDASPAMLFKNKCFNIITKMLLFTNTKSADTNSAQKRADRIAKNKKAFYPEKLGKAADLFLFLQTLELECKRVPHWETVVTFQNSNTGSCKLYDFFTFMNDQSIMKSMNSNKWQFDKEIKEGSLTLYMSTWSSLSKPLQKEMSVFKDDIDFNGSKLLVYIINALRPEITVLRSEAMDYIGKLQTTIEDQKWDLLSIIPDLNIHVQTLINVGDSLDLVHTNIVGALGKCTNTNFSHDVLHWTSNNKNHDSKSGKKTIKFLKACITYVHAAIRKNSWEFAIPATYDKTTKKRKADDDDLALSSFQAEKKTKSNDTKDQGKELKALRSELKQTQNSLKQVRANYAKGGGKQNPQREKQRPAPKLRNFGNFDITDPIQYGENAFFKNITEWMKFVRGESIVKEQAVHGFNVNNNKGDIQTWFWCKHCNKCGNHREEVCKRKNKDKNKHRIQNKSYPAPVMAQAAILNQTIDDDKSDNSINNIGSYSEDDE